MVTPNQAKNKWSENTEGSRFSDGVSEAGASKYDEGISGSSNEKYASGVEDFLNREGGPGGTVNPNLYDWKGAASGQGSKWQSNASAAADKYERNTGSDESDRWLSEYARAYQE